MNRRTLFLGALAAGFAPVLARQAAAHSWYDFACCSGRDCAPAPVHAVSEERGGWRVTLQPGEHPMVPAGSPARTWLIAFNDPRIRKSRDGAFHPCVAHVGGDLLCLYVPPEGS